MQKKFILLGSFLSLAAHDQKIVNKNGHLYIQSDGCQTEGQECSDNGRPGTCLEKYDTYYNSSTNTMDQLTYQYCEHNNDPQLVTNLCKAANEGKWLPLIESSPTQREIAEVYMSPNITLAGKAFLANFFQTACNAYVYEAHSAENLAAYFYPVIDRDLISVFDALVSPMLEQTHNTFNQPILSLTSEAINFFQETNIYEYIQKKLADTKTHETHRQHLANMQYFLSSYGIKPQSFLQKGKTLAKKIKTESSSFLKQVVAWVADQL